MIKQSGWPADWGRVTEKKLSSGGILCKEFLSSAGKSCRLRRQYWRFRERRVKLYWTSKQAVGALWSLSTQRVNHLKVFRGPVCHNVLGRTLHYFAGIGRLVGENSLMSAKVVTLYNKIYNECNGFLIKIWYDCYLKSSLKMQSNQYQPT